MQAQMTQTVINGIDTGALKRTMDTIRQDPSQGMSRFQVTTSWMGGTRSETRVDGWYLGGQHRPKNYTIMIDEPPELLGTNTAPNPQEYLMASVNACMMATYVAACAMQGITLESLEIEMAGDIDLRGFLGIDGKVPPGYTEVAYTVRIKGDGTPEQYQKVHQWVMKTSPNFWNLSTAIKMKPTLEVC